jgi:hypothetical protein
MKRYEFLIGFLLGFATLLVILLLTSDFAAHYEICEPTHSGAKECSNYNVLSYAIFKLWTALDALNGAITAIATAFIAWFTFSLRESTDKLWDAGERQLKLIKDNSSAQTRDTQDSIAVAKRSAEAAELAAKAAVSSRIASVRVGAIRLFEPGPPYDQIDTGYTKEILEGRVPANAQILIPFENIGETNAEITGICFQYWVGPRLEPLPTYDRHMPFTETVIKAGAKWEYRPGNFFFTFTEPQNRMLDLVMFGRLWVYGYIAYLDFMGMPHERRFCQRWVTMRQQGEAFGFVPEFYIPQQYLQSH